MKKILLAIAVTLSLSGCSEPDIVYIDKETGVKISEGHKSTPLRHTKLVHKWGSSNIICLNGVQYWDLTQRLAPRFDINGKLFACHDGMTTYDLK
jgi:uncharacterized protein YceK